MKSFGIELSDDDKRLLYLSWTPKLHKSPVKHRFIAGSSKCTTKQLSSLLTKILTVIKTGLQKYCSIKTSHTGVNNMWILKNSTNLLSSLGHLGVHKATSIQTFDLKTKQLIWKISRIFWWSPLFQLFILAHKSNVAGHVIVTTGLRRMYFPRPGFFLRWNSNLQQVDFSQGFASNNILGLVVLAVNDGFLYSHKCVISPWSTEGLEVLTPQSTLSYHPCHALRLASP